MSLTAEDIRNCTMIALDQPPWWPVGPIEGFRFTIEMTDDKLEYKAPIMLLVGTISWGDGTSEEVSYVYPSFSINKKHTYSSAGKYHVTIHGNLTYFYAASDFNIISVDTPFPRSMSEAQSTIFLSRGAMFESCINLVSIPEHLFDYCTGLTVFNRFFDNCRKLKFIPSGLFANHANATSFKECFRLCIDLRNIPEDTFLNCERAENFSGCFSNAVMLTSIPKDLFYTCTSATDFSGCFSYCTMLSTIPEDGIFGSVGENFDQCFYSCPHLQSIPTSFAFPSTALSFCECFAYSGLTSIPEHASWFHYCQLAEDFTGCFSYCYDLTEIRGELFADLRGAKDFTECFYYCQSLEIIYGSVFARCHAIDFTRCFDSCFALSFILAGIFVNCVYAETFEYCFGGTNLYQTNMNLFRGCINAVSFKGCFSNSGDINYPGVDHLVFSLFDDCIHAEDFSECFSMSRVYNVDTDLFANCLAANNFTKCFYGCWYIGYDPIYGTTYYHYPVPRLWETHPGADHDYCYSGCIHATGYPSIPEDWGGPHVEPEPEE